MLSDLLIRLRSLFRRKAVETELEDELRFHLDCQIEKHLRAGFSAAEARRRARLELGGFEQMKEECRDARGVILVETTLQDFRYGLRQLRRSPAFTLVAVLTLGIGIGANTAVFSVLNCVLFEPLPYPKAGELVELRQIAPGAAGLASFSDGLRLSPSMYFTYARQNRAFQSLGVWATGTASVTGLATPEQVRYVLVSEGVLEALNVPPAIGRWLSRADQVPQGPKTVMLSYGYWQRRFGGDRSVIGRNITVDSRLREIVGVMPQGFHLVDADFDLIVPIAFDRSKLILAGFGYQGIARLRPGITIAQADADLARMVPIWMRSWSNGPGTNPLFYETWKITPALRPLKRAVIGNIGNVLWVLMGTIGVVMLIACANVANLLLVRVDSRRQEIAIRAALGAGRGRIVKELLLQSVLLGLAGGALGVGLAYEGLRLLVAMGPAGLPRLTEITLDGRALGVAVLLSLLSSLLFGLIPAFKYAGPRISESLRSVGRAATASAERLHLRNLLVVAQVAMALILLVSAGLMVRTFQALRSVEPGFIDAPHLETFRISIPASLVATPQQVTRTQNDIADKLAQVPGVTSVGFASSMPMEGMAPAWDTIEARGQAHPGEVTPLRLFENVSPQFFHTTGTRIIAGREFTWSDVYGTRPVVMVSENLARELWGAPSAALGKSIREFSSMPWHEVIGVVQDVRENGVQEKAPAIVYWPTMMEDLYGPHTFDAVRTVTFAVRSSRTGTEKFLNQIRDAVWSVNSSLPLATVQTMQEIYARSLSRTSFTLVVLGIAGAMALALGIIGIYGVISYAVSQRTHEIGIRVALGAHSGHLLGMVIGQGLKLTLIGVGLGIAGALGLMQSLSSLLFGVTPTDPLTFTGVAILLALVALSACYVPARRAMRVDPIVALRNE
jgi:predicted permease